MVENFVSYSARLRSHYRTHTEDFKALAYTALAGAFILSFDQWGETSFDALTGIINFVAALAICAIGIGIHDAAHRIAALKMGYDIEHRIWFAGLIASIALVIISRGAFKIYLFESMALSAIRLHRMGRYPVMGTTWEYGFAYMAGPIASLVFAGMLASIAAASGIHGGLLGLAVQFNLIYGLLALLPLPPLDGMWILYYSRGVFIGLVTGGLAYVIMTLFGVAYWPPLAISILLGLIIGICWMYYLD